MQLAIWWRYSEASVLAFCPAFRCLLGCPVPGCYADLFDSRSNGFPASCKSDRNAVAPPPAPSPPPSAPQPHPGGAPPPPNTRTHWTDTHRATPHWLMLCLQGTHVKFLAEKEPDILQLAGVRQEAPALAKAKL